MALPTFRRLPSGGRTASALAAAVLGAAALCTAPAAVLHAQAAPSIPHEKYTLPNGLEVILHVDRSVPIVAVENFYKVGSGDEKRGRTGFAHLFEHVMFMGSQNVPVGKFDEWLEAAGASNNGSTNFDRTNYYETGPSNALPLMLWLDADRMGWLLPTMDQSKLDIQRDVVKNERRQSYDNAPYGRAFETILPVLYPADHPYSWPVIGSLADLSAAALDDVKDFFRTYYAPNNATITIAGDFDPDSAKAWVNKYFGHIPRGSTAITRPTTPPVRITRDTLMLMEDRVQLPRVYYTWPGVKTYSEDDAALDALADILANGKSSRLYRTLVYDKQIAQDVGMGNNSNKLDGMLMLTSTAKPGVHPRELDAEVAKAIAEIAERGVTERELTRVKNGMRASTLDRLASVLGKATQLSTYNYFTGNPDYMAQDLARYERLTVADVQRVARQYLVSRPKIVLTVVPEGKKDLALTSTATASPAAGSTR
ncbi:M16 family metallopeptidase [Gemmatimonas sp. UBA7669]|uniref:M16 family metallopeptidase n=1 Tax=Gemmatimonas sp. UBA7669 TaxID=1946568 RepID=UPI0025BD264A|nr:pitrilysin family protein [Gemmatimonas sp. UBA7669]